MQLIRSKMSDLDFTICCTVTFYSKKRKTPPNLNNGKYCPHFVIKGFDQLLGVNFIEGEEVIFKNKQELMRCYFMKLQIMRLYKQVQSFLL